jgi:hypothetical protein
MFAYHLWWHKALFHLDADDTASTLKLFDEKISAAGFGQALELLDGSSLLWRISLLGHDVGGRWNVGRWAAEAHRRRVLAFNMNAVAFVALAIQGAEAADRTAVGAGTGPMR